MLALYLFCAGLGIPLVLLFAFSGSDADADVGGFDADVDAGVDFDADLGGVGDFTGLIRRIPISSYAFFLAFFGGFGSVGTWLDFGFATTLILAVVIGVIAAAVNTTAFAFLRATGADSALHDREIEGRVATVSVPIEDGKRGRVWIDTGNERIQLTADSVQSEVGRSFTRGDKVLIVEMDNGVAQVMSVDPELELGDESDL